MLRTARWRKTLRKRATWALGVAAVGFREDLSTCPSTGGSGAFGGTQLGTMERRPWHGMGGFINAPAQNECSGGLGWIEASAGQYSVIPSSILTHFSKWPSCLAAWAVSALFFRSDVLEDDESTITVRACACLCVPVRACFSATYASPNFRAFLTCRAPENWKSRPEAATSTPTNPRSRCTTKSTTIQALATLRDSLPVELERTTKFPEFASCMANVISLNLPIAPCQIRSPITHAGF